MCGITGYYSESGFFSDNDLQIMMDKLIHRGPDAQGSFKDNNFSMGHRRLKILDLSENAGQPMVSHDGRYVMVYNGEVYNFNEIANELKTLKKIQFRSSSDSEVILEAFAHFGFNFIYKLNGMFAIAIYDKEKKEMHLFRDRIGIKPLFYYQDESNFAFASEIKGLTCLPQIVKEINYTSIRTFLNIGYIPPPDTIYNNIKKLSPGGYLKISKDGLDYQRYWSVGSAVSTEVISNEKKALVKLSDLLSSSVQYQLKSDVPFGVFLSGGIDSSLITAQAVNLTSVKVNTFSIGFEENRYNESEYAGSIARFLNTNHHEFIVSYKDAVGLIEKYFDAYDEPFADSSGIPTMLVSKMAGKHVTVTLSGEGGDELFLGYGFYKWAQRLNNPFIKTFHKPMGKLLAKLPGRYERISQLLRYQDETRLKSHIFSQEQYFFSDTEMEKLLSHDFKKNKLSSPKQPKYYQDMNEDDIYGKRKLSAMESQALFDIRYYLPGDLLTKVDRASMQYSVETRVPYLDHRLVEFALNISPNLKYRNGISKYILKQVLYQYIPERYFARPKQGFAIPLEKWLLNDLRYLIDENLSESVVRKYDIVDHNEVTRLKTEFFAGKLHLYNRIWILIVLHKWLVKNHV